MADPIRFRVSDPADLSRLTFDPERDPALTEALITLIGAPLPAPLRPSGSVPRLIWQGPQDFLIEGLGERKAAVATVVTGRSALFGDAGAGLVAFDLAGDGFADRLASDRPHAGPASRVMRLADLRVTALWSGDGWAVRLYVERSYAHYFRQWLVERWRAVPA